MSRSRFGEQRIIAMLKEREAGVATADACRKHGVSGAAFCKWKAKYGGLEGEPCAPLVQARWRATPGG
jgi:putative transposase